MSYALEGSVVDTLNDYAAVRYTNVAFIALMIYDHIVTVDAEVSRIWTLRWSLPKVLFLINRYLVPPMLIFDTIIQTLFNLSEDTCAFVARWTAWPIIVSLGTVDWILLLRVFAISGHRPALRYILYIFFSISLAAWIALSALITARTHGTPGGAFFPGCLYSAPVYFYAAWIPGVVFESVIILLTLYYCYFYYSAKMVNPTLRVFARDSMLYFTAMFSFLLTNLFTARFGKDFLGSLFIVCVSCIAAARMMMNIREITDADGGGGRTRNISTRMDFVSGPGGEDEETMTAVGSRSGSGSGRGSGRGRGRGYSFASTSA